MATIYGPIQYPPLPLLAFKISPNQPPQLALAGQQSVSQFGMQDGTQFAGLAHPYKVHVQPLHEACQNNHCDTGLTAVLIHAAACSLLHTLLELFLCWALTWQRDSLPSLIHPFGEGFRASFVITIVYCNSSIVIQQAGTHCQVMHAMSRPSREVVISSMMTYTHPESLSLFFLCRYTAQL